MNKTHYYNSEDNWLRDPHTEAFLLCVIICVTAPGVALLEGLALKLVSVLSNTTRLLLL